MISAWILGLAGSVHCVGMCGPLMFALPLDAASRRRAVAQTLVYHTGRVLTYAALGLFFGLAGKGLVLAGLQKGMSLFAGVFMLFMAFFAWRFEQLVVALPGFGRITQRVKHQMGRLMQRHGTGSLLSLGILNGLLPCGMVYAALAGAIATGQALSGALYMAVFGLGTAPLLLIAAGAGRSFGKIVRTRLRVLQPVLLTVVGLLLLSRGLHLDLELFRSAVPPAELDCH